MLRSSSSSPSLPCQSLSSCDISHQNVPANQVGCSGRRHYVCHLCFPRSWMSSALVEVIALFVTWSAPRLPPSPARLKTHECSLILSPICQDSPPGRCRGHDAGILGRRVLRRRSAVYSGPGARGLRLARVGRPHRPALLRFHRPLGWVLRGQKKGVAGGVWWGP